ncbi:pyrophosphatase PpaX [Hazenella sp. IB182357]|uniref:Pyrophosphatase PpaX n=1 Tax=Polycladospora coralii TaxID=2771432 RepID=A0A926NF16_9BACL|nr:pyrophosphatase PpaX [Polycladospora coralii]MBD1372228.1 pyrophosphatase PpaX [Polycladospora coralii]
MKYTAVLFDLDGTLIDTNELILASFMHTLQEYCPGKFCEADVIPHLGEPLQDQMKRFDPNQVEQMVHTYRVFNRAWHDHYVTAFPGVVEVLHELKKRSVKLAVVTNKGREMAERGLQLFGLNKWIDQIVCVDDTSQPKPAPDMILLALQQLNILKTEAVMVGDSRFDLLAAQRAGVDRIAVKWSLHWKELEMYQPDDYLETMNDLLPIVLGTKKEPAR